MVLSFRQPLKLVTYRSMRAWGLSRSIGEWSKTQRRHCTQGCRVDTIEAIAKFPERCLRNWKVPIELLDAIVDHFMSPHAASETTAGA